MHGLSTEKMLAFNCEIIEEFRANGGKCGGYFEGNPMLLLTMTGAKSGRELTTPLTHHAFEGGYVVMASAGGAPEHPAWYHNLRAHPDVSIEVGTERLAVRASELEGEDRTRAFESMTAALPRFAEYQAKVERTIPIVKLTPT